ncbi:MAG TPA: Na+/H+ antiporter [Methylomirabilota bacterium]|nr:Na+/H+ antiporter [Methylomirabilota bacterium]
MHSTELVLGLFLAVAALVTAARRLEIAYPIFLVMGGLILGFLPGVPRVYVDPQLLFVIVLPPLLYIAGYFTPVRGLRANLVTVSSLAVGLVIASAVAAALVARCLIPGMPWAAAFVLGAIVAPPDAIAATSIITRLDVPRQVVTVLEGESLLNDATALTMYSIGLAVAGGSVFSAGAAVGMFSVAMLGGIAVGIAVGWLVAQVRVRLEDTPVEMTISLLTPYAAYLPAERLGVSGVIATVAAGLYLGHRGSQIMGADARLTGRALWETLTFLLNGFVFIIMGLEVPPLLSALTWPRATGLIAVGVVVTVTLVLVRAGWIMLTVFLPQRRQRGDALRCAVVLSWAGMRGVVSLAAALAVPLAFSGERFAARDAIVIVTVTVIVATLLGQGLTLPWLIRRLGVGTDAGSRTEEEVRARERLLEAATKRLDELYEVWPGHRPLLDQLRETFRHRSEHVERQRTPASDGAGDRELIEHREIRRTIIDAEREALLRLQAEGDTNEALLRELERELDLEERRMDA